MSKKRRAYPECGADKELLYLIKSRHTLIYVVTWEEQRVIDALVEICDRADVFLSGVQVWDAALGLRTSDGAVPPGGEDLANPDRLLDFLIEKATTVIEEEQEEKAKESRGPIYVLCDIFRFLSGAKLTPQFERKIKHLGYLLKMTSMTVVFASPELVLPSTLEKAVTVIDYPLPNKEQLTLLVDSIKRKLLKRDRITQEASDEPTENIVRACLGLTVQEAEDAIARAVVVTGRFDIQTILDIKRQIIRKGEVLDYVYSDDSLSGVGGLEGLKHWVRLKKQSISERAQEYGNPYPKGVFLLGLQGTGKSLCAKAVANELQVPLLKLDISRCLGSYVGQSEGNVRRALKLAESVSPCVLFIDEIDFNASGSNDTDTSGVAKRIMSMLLDWMQERKGAVFVVAAANSASGLPPALLRKGRFDELFFVDLPNVAERKAIFEIHLSKPRGPLKRTRDPKNFDLNILVQTTEGFSGAEIENCIIDAMVNAFADGEREFKTEDICEAIKNCKPLSYFMREQLQALRKEMKDRMRPASEILKATPGAENDRFEFLGPQDPKDGESNV